MVITNSPWLAAALAEAAALAPKELSAYMLLGTKSNTVSAWPAFRRFRAIGAPMWPRPMNAMFI